MAILTIIPDFVYEESINKLVLVSGFENRAEQRRLKWKSPERIFMLRFVNRSKVDYEYMRDFFLARDGQFESFDWENKLDSVTYKVRFVDGSFKTSWSRYAVYNFEVSVKEVAA